MSLVSQIEDKGAVVEWSPLSTRPNLVALGTKDSSSLGFDDYGGELEIHSLNFSNSTTAPPTTVLGKAKVTSRFSSLAWSPMSLHQSVFPHGLIAGGMMDGYINVWDPAKIISSSSQPLLASVEQHQGAICGLQFNPHRESAHLLASGGSDQEVFVMSLERPEQPSVFVPCPPPTSSKHTADITKVAWNSQVSHILASAASNGVSYIWDLKQKKAWCELRDPSGGSVADIAWNPEQGLHFLTASGEDRSPLIRLYDLRSSTTVPLATLQGHTEGILSLSWCKHDPSLLLSCGKDNQTILWDLNTLQPVYNIPLYSKGRGGGRSDSADAPKPSPFSDSPFSSNSSATMFGGLSNVSQRRHYVSWSPCLKSMITTSSLDRKVQFLSLSGTQTTNKRAPKWLKRTAGCCFGFGGKLAVFDSAAFSSSSGGGKVKVVQVAEDIQLVDACDKFQTFLSTHSSDGENAYKSYCEMKSQSTELSPKDKQIWELMNVICFGKNAREELLKFLGFKTSEIKLAAEKYLQNKSGSNSSTSAVASVTTVAPPLLSTTTSFSTNVTASAQSVFGGDSNTFDIASPDGDDFFSKTPPPSVSSSALLPLATTPSNKVSFVSESIPEKSEIEKDTERLIREAIIVGDFKTAVNVCLETNQLAEALILAQCGEQELWQKTQDAFFEKQRNKSSFIGILNAIIKSDLSSYVVSSDLAKWKETLSVLSTYGKSEEFPKLCEKLALRLLNENLDAESATLCFMCAANVTQTVTFWTEELRSSFESASRSSNPLVSNNASLQNYVEKVTLFSQANPNSVLPEQCSKYFAEYANLLASHGRFETAMTYLKGISQSEKILIDRLYHASPVTPALKNPPAFPFEKITVASSSSSSVNNVVNTVTAANSTNAVFSTNTTNVAKSVPVAAASTNSTSSKTTNSLSSKQVHPSAHPSAHPSQQVFSPVPSASQALPAGWSKAVDQNSGKTYYFNVQAGKTQWEPPVEEVVTQVQAISIQSPSQPKVFTPVAQVTQMASSRVPGASAFTPNPVVAPAPAPAPVEVKPKELLPDSEAVILLGQIIAAVGEVTTAAEKKQMTMVYEGFECLKKRGQEDILQKVYQLASDIASRNFVGASAVQADLANNAWNQHKDWIKCMKVFIQIAAKK